MSTAAKFVPKVIGVVALLVVLLPWMMRTMIEFTRAVFERIPSMVN